MVPSHRNRRVVGLLSTGDFPDIPHLTDVWRALVEYVVELRTGRLFPEITPDTQKLSADLRRLILPSASLAVYGINLAVPTARVPEPLLEQFVAQEDQSRRPTFKKAETRQFLVAARPFLSAPVRYSLAEIVAMMARGERHVAPLVPGSEAPPAADVAGSSTCRGPASAAPPAAPAPSGSGPAGAPPSRLAYTEKTMLLSSDDEFQ